MPDKSEEQKARKAALQELQKGIRAALRGRELASDLRQQLESRLAYFIAAGNGNLREPPTLTMLSEQLEQLLPMFGKNSIEFYASVAKLACAAP
jgi:hypothetical protein